LESQLLKSKENDEIMNDFKEIKLNKAPSASVQTNSTELASLKREKNELLDFNNMLKFELNKLTKQVNMLERKSVRVYFINSFIVFFCFFNTTQSSQ
jgi:hypothetical protein